MYRAAVIGSGFGGLAAAIRLQSSGISTVLFEKRDKPGGRAYVYHDQGFTFDAGPTVITAPHCLHELFELGGRALGDYVKLTPVNPFYRLLWESGASFDYDNDPERLLAQIRAKSPLDVKGYEKFFKYSQEVFHEGYEKLVDVPFLRLWDMVRVSPQLMRLQAYRSVYAMVSHFIHDPELRQGFSFHSLLIGGNPFTSSSIYTLIHALERKWGVFFPMGGTHALVRALVKLFEELGGEVHLGEEIDHFETVGEKIAAVHTEGGKRYSVDFVVSNADVVHTYQHLLRKTKRVRRRADRLAKAPHSMSLFLLYFGTKKKYPEIAHHSVLFGARYKELLADIFQRGLLSDDFSLYLHAPCRTDASLAPPGCDAFYALAPVPHLGKANVDWEGLKRGYAEKVLAYLEARCLPGLRENLVTQRIFTPLDFQHELNAHWGSAFSLEPLLRQSAYFRVSNRDRDVPNLYFVGAGTHPGAGLPGVMNSAKATVRTLLQDFSVKTRVPFALREPVHVG